MRENKISSDLFVDPHTHYSESLLSLVINKLHLFTPFRFFSNSGCSEKMSQSRKEYWYCSTALRCEKLFNQCWM